MSSKQNDIFCFILFCSLFLFFDLVLFLCFGFLYFSKILFSLLKNLMVCLTCDHFVTWLRDFSESPTIYFQVDLSKTLLSFSKVSFLTEN